VYHRTSYDPLLDGPPPEPRHVDDSLSISDDTPIAPRRWSRRPVLAGARRRLGSALIELGRLISPELRSGVRGRQVADQG
jgi:hypothetical protein